jgi:hypothetical protein
MIPIIRVFWGSQEFIWNEVPLNPLFDEELVIVWGVENEDRFKSMGYKTYLMARTESELEFSTIWDHFAHKLMALKVAEDLYEEYLFLDWDIQIVKPLDFHFWNLIKNGKAVQCPLYAYPLNYEKSIINLIDSTPEKNWDLNLKSWLRKQIQTLNLYHWSLDNLLVVPNFCFFYSRRSEIMNNLLHIYKKLEIKTCIEEFSFLVWANCNMDEYILKYEPSVIDGRPDEYSHFDIQSNVSKQINQYTRKFINKDIYLKHI